MLMLTKLPMLVRLVSAPSPCNDEYVTDTILLNRKMTTLHMSFCKPLNARHRKTKPVTQTCAKSVVRWAGAEAVTVGNQCMAGWVTLLC